MLSIELVPLSGILVKNVFGQNLTRNKDPPGYRVAVFWVVRSSDVHSLLLALDDGDKVSSAVLSIAADYPALCRLPLLRHERKSGRDVIVQTV